MRATSNIPALGRWRLWFGALVVLEFLWFLVLRPYFSGSFFSHPKLMLPPLTVVGYVYLLGAVSGYLENLEWDYRMRQLIVIMLGLSVGLFVFALMTLTTAQLEGEAG